jgi:aspartate aminotransferase
LEIASETCSCAPTPIQIAARIAYQIYDKTIVYLNYQIALLKQLGNYCGDRLNDTNVKVHAQ